MGEKQMKRTIKRAIFSCVLTIIVFAILACVWLWNDFIGYLLLGLAFMLCFFSYSGEVFDWLIKPDKENNKR